jgi:hypothetical protein
VNEPRNPLCADNPSFPPRSYRTRKPCDCQGESDSVNNDGTTLLRRYLLGDHIKQCPSPQTGRLQEIGPDTSDNAHG